MNPLVKIFPQFYKNDCLQELKGKNTTDCTAPNDNTQRKTQQAPGKKIAQETPLLATNPCH